MSWIDENLIGSWLVGDKLNVLHPHDDIHHPLLSSISQLSSSAVSHLPLTRLPNIHELRGYRKLLIQTHAVCLRAKWHDSNKKMESRIHRLCPQPGLLTTHPSVPEVDAGNWLVSFPSNVSQHPPPQTRSDLHLRLAFLGWQLYWAGWVAWPGALNELWHPETWLFLGDELVSAVAPSYGKNTKHWNDWSPNLQLHTANDHHGHLTKIQQHPGPFFNL